MSAVVGENSKDVIWSDATMEHLSHVWVAVAEMASVLRMGGITVHITHQTFPVHDHPSDYWRFTKEAMGSLFCTAAGFHLIDSQYAWEIGRVNVPNLPLFEPCYVHTMVIAEKICDPCSAFEILKRFMW